MIRNLLPMLSLALLLPACNKGESDTNPPVQAEEKAPHGDKGHHDCDGKSCSKESCPHAGAAGDHPCEGDCPHGGKGHGGKHEMKSPEEHADKMMSKLDADSSGAISAEEAKGSHFEKMFEKADADGDGRATRDELLEMMKAHHEEMKARHGEGGHGKGHGKAHGKGHHGDAPESESEAAPAE